VTVVTPARPRPRWQPAAPYPWTVTTIRPLGPADAEACDAIVASLPYHFGLEDGRRECAAAVRSQPGLVAEEDGEVIGFLTVQPRFETAAEITWMAVRADRRGRHVGRALMDRLATDLRAEGRRLLLVLTVSPSDGPDDIEDGYQATRAFYAANGFDLARDFGGYWGDHDTPVLLVRVLAAGGARGRRGGPF
jgi:ribosomal protein S18 acetylase RimI-like enzyme